MGKYDNRQPIGGFQWQPVTTCLITDVVISIMCLPLHCKHPSDPLLYLQARMTQPETSQTPKSNWWDAYPAFKSSAPLITPEDLAVHLRARDGSVAVIDVQEERPRCALTFLSPPHLVCNNNDVLGRSRQGQRPVACTNVLWRSPKFLEQYRNTEKVVFYCMSSSGRGPRCAGW